jgi:hypothetical protein
MEDWWSQAFPAVPYEKSPPEEPNMLIVVAYDISDNKRLAKVQKHAKTTAFVFNIVCLNAI